MNAREEEFAAAWENDRIGTDLVVDAPEMRVWHVRLAPGDRLPAHRHDRPYYWTVLTGGEGRSRFDTGLEVDAVYKAGDTKHFKDLSLDTGFVHDLMNTGDTELVFLTVEFNA